MKSKLLGLITAVLVFAMSAVAANAEADLADYPYPFDRGKDTLIVVGDRASSQEILAATDIMLSLSVEKARLASEVADIKAHNAIVVGGACANAAAAAILNYPTDCTTSAIRDAGRIMIVEHGNGNSALYVAGWSTDDTRRAAKVLVDYKKWVEAGKLKGKEVKVTGTSLTDIEVTPVASEEVVKCTDSDRGMNYNKRGTVKYNLNFKEGYQYSLTDSCSGNTLNEYYCDPNGNAQTAYYSCPDGCSNGACIEKFKGIGNTQAVGLYEGETAIYVLSANNKEYETTAEFVGRDEAKFAVNGEVTDSLAVRQKGYKLVDGTIIKVSAIDVIASGPNRVIFEFAAAPSVVIVPKDGNVKGFSNAPVTMVEYSDFQCPFCYRFFDQTLPQIEENYIETGKVKLVYKHFPLSSIHPEAQKAAEAAECANEQGKFWEMHDMLFKNQANLDVSSLKSYARQIGLDTAEFNGCLDSGEKARRVQNDYDEGYALGNRGTPGFYINGKQVSGAQPYSVFQQAIDEALKDIGKTKTLPPFKIAVDDRAPASDVISANKVAQALKEKGYDVPVGTVKLFGEINADFLDKKVTLVIYKGEARLIIGETSPSSHVTFGVEVAQIVKDLGIESKTILSSQTGSGYLEDLFVGGGEEEISETPPVLTEPPMFPNEKVASIELERGWNLISVPGELKSFLRSDCTANRKLIGFVYLPERGEYVTMQEAQKLLGNDFGRYASTHAFWVYSYNECTLKASVSGTSIDVRTSVGWNLLPITEKLMGRSFSELTSSCDLEQAYTWNAASQNWDEISDDEVFYKWQENNGMIIKSANSCTVG